jgi:hypothetical protein
MKYYCLCFSFIIALWSQYLLFWNKFFLQERFVKIITLSFSDRVLTPYEHWWVTPISCSLCGLALEIPSFFSHLVNRNSFCHFLSVFFLSYFHYNSSIFLLELKSYKRCLKAGATISKTVQLDQANLWCCANKKYLTFCLP